MSPTDDVISLIHGRNEHGVEEDGPDAVVGFVQPDVLIHEGVGDVEQLRTVYVHSSMAQLHFTWHATKARANVAKHGISFEEAETVFADEDAIIVADPEHSKPMTDSS